MRQRKIRGLAVLSLLLSSLSFATPAHAITNGQCNVTVSSPTGVVLVESGGYCYLAFTATGANSFTVPTGITSSAVLVVAGGGGGGGGAWGGGGGAGGVLYGSSYPLTPGTSMNLSVGGGGTGGAADLGPTLNRAGNGTNSWINSSTTFVAKGGGAGAGYAYGSDISYAHGAAGGSGGGATEHGSGGSGGTSNQTLPTNATTSYGNAGGNGAAGSGYVAGAGGGGAGGAGGAMTTSAVGGNGGSGTTAFSAWFTAIGQFGVGGAIAGGGGGGSSTTAGTGGSGGGGAGGGSSMRAGSNGTANTGGGGGGASYASGAYVGGTGGSGLIIFKFSSDVTAPTIATSASLNAYETSTAITSLSADETVTWSITSGVDVSLVSISSNLLSFTALRDFESPIDSGANNTFNFTIRATDGSGNYSQLAITVTLLNVNEAPVLTFNSGNNYSASIAENSSAITTITATDVDAGSSLVYSLSGVDASDFAIGTSNGVLAFASAPDYEAPIDSDLNNIYLATVQVSDGALVDTLTVTITVTNLNEVASISISIAPGNLYKGLSTTITISTDSPGKVRFYMDGARIGNCLSVSTTGAYPSASATCAWKPSVTNRHYLTATITPTNGTFSARTSQRLEVFIMKRLNSR